MHLSKLCALGAALTFVFTSAAIAQATKVNVTDPTAGRAAHVEIGGRLAVQEVPPTSYFHSVAFSVSSGRGCVVLATAPGGKALIVNDVRINVFDVATTGGGNGVSVFDNADCSPTGGVGEVNPATIGLITMPFGPGIAIPAGSGVSVKTSGSPNADVYLDGYVVGSSVAPVVGQSLQIHGTPRAQQR